MAGPTTGPSTLHLGQSSAIPASPEQAVLDRVPNPHPETDYLARFSAPEFTSICPVTGQPDFGILVIDYLPGDWLVLQRHNPCLPSNTVAVYFDARYRRTGAAIGSTGLNDPPITTWTGAPANVSAVAITSVVQDQARYFYAAYTVTYPLARTLQINPVGTEIVATHYDPASRRIWPWLAFGGSPAAVNWHGYTPKDSAQPAAYPTTTALKVDGVAIPAGTSWSQYGTSGQLNISVKWKIARERDL
jgi:hypothetical protein